MPRNIITSGGTGKVSIKGDKDAKDYIRKVEIADGQFLESSTRNAIVDFVIGCKNDGTWDAIKSSCILAGARTLTGALTPLKGTAPTNFNFISSDYNRATGLIGDGSTKYLNANRNNNADPQNSKHFAFFISSVTTTTNSRFYMGNVGAPGPSLIYADFQFTINTNTSNSAVNGGATGFKGVTRINSTTCNYLFTGSTPVTFTQNSATPTNVNILIFNGANANAGGVPFATGYVNARIAFYSIGENLNLSLLRARINALMSVYSTLT